MVLDRLATPTFRDIETFDFQKPQKFNLSNGTPVYLINSGTQEVLKIELIFDAGSVYQSTPLVAGFTNAMLNEGTSRLSAEQIAEKFDFHGAFTQYNSDKDQASVSLFTLCKFLGETLSLLTEVLEDAAISEDEIQIMLNNEKQKFHVNRQKVSVLARSRFLESVYGENNPYGRKLSENHFNQIDRDKLVSFYNSHYKRGNCRIIVSGKIDDKVENQLHQLFGKTQWNSSQTIKSVDFDFSPLSPGLYIEPKNDSVQSAIRIGRLLFNKTHKDYTGMRVLNTILGGYFGSRLMTNIREDKGYTYGIGSGIASFQKGGYFFISSEVGSTVVKNTLHEVFFELNRLRNDLVGEEELTRVKNFMLGEFMREIDGPFALADKLKGLLKYNLEYTFYEEYIKTIKAISPDDIQYMASVYLKEEDMIQVVAGNY